MSSRLNLRYGLRVPDGAINLAWITFPEITPEHNVYLSDVASTNPANTLDYWRTDLYPAVASWNVSIPQKSVTLPNRSTKTHAHLSVPIEVLSPVEDETGAWHLRITDGVFTVISKLSYNEAPNEQGRSWISRAAADAGWQVGDYVAFTYSVQDILMKAAVTPDSSVPLSFAGLESVVDQEAVVVSENTIQIPNANIHTIASITVNGGDNLLLEGATSRTIDNANRTSAMVVTSDLEAGVITLNRTISYSDVVSVSYSYRPNYYIYRGYFDDDNPDATKRRFVDLDLNPTAGHVYDGTNQTSGSVSGKGLLDSVVYVYALPTAAYLYKSKDDASGSIVTGNIEIYRAIDYGVNNVIRWQAAPVLSHADLKPLDSTITKLIAPIARKGAYGVAKFDGTYYYARQLDARSPEQVLDSDTGWGLRAGGIGELADYPSAVVLAKVFVAPAATLESVKVLDTRSRGGGVTDEESVRNAALTGERLLEANACWDVSSWDGEPVMLNATVVFDIPQAMLKDSGVAGPYRKFTEAELYEIIKKNVPAGIKPILRFV